MVKRREPTSRLTRTKFTMKNLRSDSCHRSGIRATLFGTCQVEYETPEMLALDIMAVEREPEAAHKRYLGSWEEPRSASPAMDGGVVHEVPNELPDRPVPALVHLRRLDDLLLQGGRDPPVHHVARSFVLIGSDHEAGIVRAQGRRKHTCAPGEPRRDQILRHPVRPAAATRVLPVFLLVQDLDVPARMNRLLLTWVRDLRDRRKIPLSHIFAPREAAKVAVANREDRAVAPELEVLRVELVGLHGLLLHDLEMHVDVNPPAAAWAALALGLGWHEVVRRLDACADVKLVRAIGELNVVPEFLLRDGLLASLCLAASQPGSDPVEGLDAVVIHVLLAVLGGGVGERAEAPRQHVDDGDLQVREEVLQLGGPLHADEARANHKYRGLLGCETLDVDVLLEDVAPAALVEPLVDVAP